MIYEKLEGRSIGTLNALELSRMLEGTVEDIFNDEEITSLRKAVDLATVLHSNQIRKNRDAFKKTPYIEHPLRNTLRLAKWGVVDLDILIASLLHDSIEDSSREYCELFLNKKVENEDLARKQLSLFINREFGSRVESIVKGVTLNPSSARANLSKEEMNKIYLETVKSEIESDQAVFLVKLSDFIDNATGLWHGDDSKFIERQIAKYRPMIQVFHNELQNIGANSQLLTSPVGYLDIVFKLNYTEEFFKSFD